ncbi:hypothetical protein [uncultured Eubacterium sp.]|nr:hypothetical protein [uncultured Eubacterium sp.]
MNKVTSSLSCPCGLIMVIIGKSRVTANTMMNNMTALFNDLSP